ncbi:MAG: orotidine-5'-phosphate decarboxylase [Leptospiraceae bacterium]|nr:orotidine-5'-phosphate decarboxylase [Leptospiraceae bacterium]MCP5510846.1 orotidine-5'-phosphate decarboxylase [Leptospiraceae bacterium]
MSFSSKFNQRLQSLKTNLCVGLDPELEKLPEFLRKEEMPLFTFSREIIDSTAAYATAYKPNIAFFERYGSKGIREFERTVEHIRTNHSNIPIVADVKRGDLANTSKEYAGYYFGSLGVDSITVSPYMGEDSLLPYLELSESHIFLLCLTSNKGSGDFQKLKLANGEAFYKNLAEFFERLETSYPGKIGIVVGATHPNELSALRETSPSLHFLIPGYGAQGGKLEEIMPIAGKLSLINSSRSILFASGGKDFAEIAGKKAEEIHKEMLMYWKD